MAIIELRNLVKVYGKDDYATLALDDVNLSIDKGEFISVMGPSGSGKSTLLNIIGCMDIQTKGEYLLKGKSLKGLSNRELSKVRNQTVSFVFQHFALLKDYSVYDNIELPLSCRKMSGKEKKEKIMFFMSKLGIQSHAKKKPTQISGGQQQRVAIARALVGGTDIILADEPTGALDQKTGRELMELLSDINREGKTIIVVTHDPGIAEYTHRRIDIVDGNIV
jgi:putative ABC transport system ATP-binding protein